jgi:hypothetical protein
MRATLLCDELPVGLRLPELDVGEAVVVTVIPAVDDGELELRHEESLDPEIDWTLETPPCLPVESVIKYRTFVPALTFTGKLGLSLFE